MRNGILIFWRVCAPDDSGSPKWPSRILSELDAADRRAESVAAGLSPFQLNWQPRPGAWSVAQCLKHLHAGNEIMVPQLSAALQGCPHAPVEEITLGWFSEWFIR